MEDNLEIIELLQEVAPISSLAATFARSSQEALDICSTLAYSFDAILVDRRLPDLHGDLLAKELRKRGYKGLLASYSSDRVDSLDPSYDTSFRKSEPVFQVLKRLRQMLEGLNKSEGSKPVSSKQREVNV